MKRGKKYKKLLCLLAIIVLCLSGCSSNNQENVSDDYSSEDTIHEENEQENTGDVEEMERENTGEIEEMEQENPGDMEEIVIEENAEQEIARPEDLTERENGFLVVIDAGHQAKGNYDKEPVGPGASEKKAKVSSGTSGCVSGLNEFELNLMVAKKLQTELENRGYQVIMVRTTHEVDISNSERAAVANKADADAFIRIHANGSENSSVNGSMTICQTPDNPYNGSLYGESKALATCVLDEMVKATGARKEYVWETDSMSGINWCQVPATIVEMGYMSNPEEDAKLATEEYQYKIAEGIANGIDLYLLSE